MGFEPGEVVRNLNYLKEGGTVVVNTKPEPTTAVLQLHDDGKEMNNILQKQNINLIA
ncbi:MAG: pyruvate ferredoxin oxidoreductase, partial [Eubacterium sp.]